MIDMRHSQVVLARRLPRIKKALAAKFERQDRLVNQELASDLLASVP